MAVNRLILSYIGDAIVGSDVNFGCGTIVVNYDGRKNIQQLLKIMPLLVAIQI